MQNSLVVIAFSVRLETLFLDKYGPKNQNRQFKPNIDTKTNSNMQNSNGGVQFFSVRWETPSFPKFCSKNQNCHFKLEFGT